MAPYPTVTSSCRTRKNSTDPSAPYTRKVIMFAAENTRDRNIDNGAMACGRSSSTTNAAMAASATRTPATITARTEGGPRGQQVRRDAQGHRPGQRAGHVEPPGRSLVARLGRPHTHQHHERTQRQVDREDPAPAGVVDQEATDERADGRCDPREARPGADGSRPVLGPERRLDEGQGAGHEQGGGGALQHAEHRQLDGRLGERAQRAAEGEAHHAEEIDPPASQPVPQCATDQDQRGQAQQVAGGDPLQLRQRGVEVEADLAQRDVDDRAVQHRDPGAERDRGQGDPAAGGAKLEEPDLRFVVRVAIRRAPRHGRP